MHTYTTFYHKVLFLCSPCSCAALAPVQLHFLFVLLHCTITVVIIGDQYLPFFANEELYASCLPVLMGRSEDEGLMHNTLQLKIPTHIYTNYP